MIVREELTSIKVYFIIKKKKGKYNLFTEYASCLPIGTRWKVCMSPETCVHD